MTNSNKDIQALVFGASGITGWAITNEALSYPTPTTFNRIVGLTSRSLSLKDSGFPADPRLTLYSALDLSQDANTITDYLKKVEKIDQITHVYFAGSYSYPSFESTLIQRAAYVHRGWGDEGSSQQVKENVDFIINAVLAVEAVCPNLQFWTFPTGGKVSSLPSPIIRKLTT